LVFMEMLTMPAIYSSPLNDIKASEKINTQSCLSFGPSTALHPPAHMSDEGRRLL